MTTYAKGAKPDPRAQFEADLADALENGQASPPAGYGIKTAHTLWQIAQCYPRPVPAALIEQARRQANGGPGRQIPTKSTPGTTVAVDRGKG